MPTTSLSDEVFGASVRVGAVPDTIDQPVIELASLRATRHEALLHIDEVADFHVIGGQEVVVQPEPGIALAACAVWLHGMVAGLVLAQQGRFALHASTVRIGSVTLAIAGTSGAGKSTTAAALGARRHTVITDEVSTVDVEGDRLVVQPSPRELRLRPDTAARLELGALLASGDIDAMGKQAFALASTQPAPLDLVVVLRRATAESPVVRNLSALEAVAAVRTHTYRRMLARLDPGAHHAWAATVAHRTRVVRIVRPETGWTVPAVVETLEGLAAEHGPIGSGNRVRR